MRNYLLLQLQTFAMCCGYLRATCWTAYLKVRGFLRDCLWWCYWLLFNRCCCKDCSRRQVYLIDPENEKTSAHAFAEVFELYVDYRIAVHRVSSSSECTEDYPIALLNRLQTGRTAEDIESTLQHLHTKELYKRTALINIHVISDKYFLPKCPTVEGISAYQDLGLIVDFGFVAKGRFNNIYPCNFSGKFSSMAAFNNFVLKGKF